MSLDTIKWLLEVLLALVAGYFAFWFAFLNIVMISEILQMMDMGSPIRMVLLINSVVCFVGFALCGYLTVTALRAAKRGGEWKWR